MDRLWAGAALCALAAAIPSLGQAQAVEVIEPAPAVQAEVGVIAYPPPFFAEFRPISASDAVQRLPGFTFTTGESVRGFGGAAGNVLIDGQRPTAKSVSLDAMLQRIPFSTIERIDLIRGGAPGIDMQGYTVVANVIRKKGTSTVRSVQMMVKPHLGGDFVVYNPRLELSTRSGRLSIDLGLGGRHDRSYESGDGYLRRHRANGVVFEEGAFAADHYSDTVGANFNGEYRGDVSTYHLNAAVDRSDTDRNELASLVTSAGLAFLERSRNKARNDKAEISADYERAFTSGITGRVLALKTMREDRLNGLSLTRGPTRQSRETAESGETILRSSLSAVRSPRLQFEFGAEGALNYLDAASSLLVGGAPVIVPSANVRVEEKRAEGSGAFTAKPRDNLTIEAGARFETSTISQTGGANKEKTLSFLKPRTIVTWAPDGLSQVRVRAERVVGQLNFRDFAASAEVDIGTVNAGNPDLEPERSWVFELALERRFWSRGALVLTFKHEEVQSVVDLIPIANQFDAPGNIGDGTRDEAKVNLTLPLDNLGIPRGQVRFNAAWRDSTVIDPVTGQERRISLQRPFEADVTITKSLPRWNSSVILEAGGGLGSLGFEETSYRISEIRTVKELPSWKLIWDWNPDPNFLIRFQWENFTSRARIRERILFDGPRSAGVVNSIEHREVSLQSMLMVRARKQF